MSKPALLNLLALEERTAPAVINFSLTTSTSKLSLAGTVGTSTITQQGTGSLTTTYSGTVKVDADLTNNTLEFLSAGSAMTAQNSGTWAPAVGGGSAFSPGSALANYGGQAPVSGLNTRVAARGMVLAFTSVPLPVSGSSFSSTQNVAITAGTVDYHNFLLQGTDSLVGSNGANAGANGTFTDLGNGNYTLVMPANGTIIDVIGTEPLVLTISGTLNATAVLPVIDLNGAGAGTGSTFTHTAGAAAAKIAPAATLSRSPAANLTGMTVTLTAAPDGNAESLAADLTGTGLSTTGYDALTKQLVITGTGTLATYQGVLQKITYSNSNTSGTPGTRPITVTVSDAGNTSLPRTADGTISLPVTAAKVTGVLPNGGGNQRSRVTSVRVDFDNIVSLPVNPADAFLLSRQSDSAAVSLSAVVDNSGPGSIVTLSFTGGPLESGSLADGRYTLTVLASQVNSGGLDGDGNGTPGDNFSLLGTQANKFFRMFGDIDGNGTVDAVDLADFGAVFGQTLSGSAFDFDTNNTINADDYAQFGNRFGTTI